MDATSLIGTHDARTIGIALSGALQPRDRDTGAVPGVRAAVMILLYDGIDGINFLLTKRPETLAHHPGQISLPGGRWEPADVDLVVTALRETEEELGIPRDAVTVVGRLADVETMVTGFVVTPIVGVSHGPVAPIPNDVEIARVMEVPLTMLLQADARLPADAAGLTLRYPLLDEDVWGATARILRDFSAAVRCALTGLV